MITCELIDLPQERDSRLKAFLNRPECRDLISVAEAQVKRFQAEGLKEALDAGVGNDKLASMNASLYKAQRYQQFVDVLKEFIGQTKPFQNAKLS